MEGNQNSKALLGLRAVAKPTLFLGADSVGSSDFSFSRTGKLFFHTSHRLCATNISGLVSAAVSGLLFQWYDYLIILFPFK